MSNPIGALLWNDLTVENATEVKDFYTSVIGWTITEQTMGDYNDYNIHNATGEVMAGICHARGVNTSTMATIYKSKKCRRKFEKLYIIRRYNY
jgi:predicted enzyme related to lactoylglutathione lyase